jgi:hypothetical protein
VVCLMVMEVECHLLLVGLLLVHLAGLVGPLVV